MTDQRRGRLKVYMGYAAGVGKTYKMLEDAQERKRRGEDIVIGYFEPHGRKATIALTEGLETIPRKTIEYRGSTFEEMDSDAILERKPRICVVDEYPHTNVPGSERAKRWEDVRVLLEAGIDVLTTMNIQHLESLNDQIRTIAAIRVRETIPDWLIEQADEIVMVDLPPQALLNRLERGVVYARDKAERAMQNFFQESTLAALRELALRQTAHEVQHRTVASGTGVEASGKPQRILMLVTAAPEAAMLIRRAKRVGDFIRAESLAIAVDPTGDLSGLGDAEREAIEQHLNFARNLQIEARIIQGEDIARVLVDFARSKQITQIFLARPRQQRHWLWFRRDLIEKIVLLAKEMQVVIVSEREPVEL